ncbi:MAG: Lon protease family protein [Thermoanaerobaculaceae bacterium]
MARELPASQLRFTCPDDWLTWESSHEVPPAAGIVGQTRAVSALEFGLVADAPGFNVFVTGLVGTGKMTAVELHLRKISQSGPAPDDLCYVFNFHCPEMPKLLRLQPGAGAILRERMLALAQQLSTLIPELLRSPELQQLLEERIEDLRQRQEQLFRQFEARVKKAGFALVQVQAGAIMHPEILALVDDRPVSLDKLQRLAEEGKLSPEEWERLAKSHQKLTLELQEVVAEATEIVKEMQRRAADLKEAILAPKVALLCKEIAAAVGDPRVKSYLKDVQDDILKHLAAFQDGQPPEDILVRYAVNLVVDNSQTQGRPVVVETEPTLTNLLGTVEARFGEGMQATTDHTRIRVGSLVRANGGFLVLNAVDVLNEGAAWSALKRALRYRQARIRPRETLFAVSGQALQPEPVELQVKVVMLGERALFDALFDMDEEFGRLFKVLADFDRDTPLTPQRVSDFLQVMAKIVQEEKLPPLDREGMRALVEEGVRLGGPRRRLTARFSDVADVLREAGFLAHGEQSPVISASHIARAVNSRRARFSLPEEKLLQFMLDNLLLVKTEGMEVGQVNGLAVYDLGYFAFGLPGRVTAQVSPGNEGVVNIEREARLSGRTHDKGVLILAGFLRGSFASRKPLSVHASIAFEQSYHGVEGDSASSAELYAILSALSGLPVRQDLAVTGSVDQLGNVQAIGGVNEKIEGFFALCHARGLSGTQGVVIPESNVDDLHLSPEVTKAVEAGKFHVYAVSHVREGMELLTGVPWGEEREDGSFPENSICDRITRRLAEMSETLRWFRHAAS